MVQVGQCVRRGEVIGRAQGYVSLPIHASSSGTVTAIEDRPVAHPSRLPARCVVIATDGSDTPAPPDWDVLTDPEQAEPHVLRDIARAAGIAGQGGATRTVAATDFFEDLFTTAVGDDELLTQIRIPKHTGWGAHYEKFVRVVHQWAIVAVAATVRVEGGTIAEARVGLTNMGSTPLRATAVALVGPA